MGLCTAIDSLVIMILAKGDKPIQDWLVGIYKCDSTFYIPDSRLTLKHIKWKLWQSTDTGNNYKNLKVIKDTVP